MTIDQKKGAIRIALIFGLALSIFTALDFGLPIKVSKEVVQLKRSYNQISSIKKGGSSSRKFGFRTDVREYPCSYGIYKLIEKDSAVEITKTALLNEIRLVKIGKMELENDYSPYKFLILPIALWLSTTIGIVLWFLKGHFGTMETMAIASVMTGLFMILTSILNNYI